MCDVSAGRLGQAKVKRSGAAIVINVMTEFESDVFKKDEIGFVFRKDKDKNIYYITRPIFNYDIKNTEEN